MKRWNLYIVVLVIAGILPGACVIEHHDSYGSSNGGKQAFAVCEDHMETLVSFLDLALRMEYYLKVPGGERPDAEQEYFPEYKIRPVHEREWAGLRARDTAFRIVTAGQPLFTEGAVWYICRYEGMNMPAWAKLTYKGEKKFALEVEECRRGVWTINASLEFQSEEEKIPAGYKAGKWKFSGSGKCVSEGEGNGRNQVILDIEMIRTLEKFAASKYFADRGEIALLVKNVYLQQEELVRVYLESKTGHTRRVRILYKGEEYPY